MNPADTTPNPSIFSHSTFEPVEDTGVNEVTEGTIGLPPNGRVDNVTHSITGTTEETIVEALRNNNLNDYEHLWRYTEELRSSNPGSTVEIMVQRGEKPKELIFQRIYVCFDACKKGWLAGCRPIFGVDGCFLKTGELLTAVGIDGDNRMYPVAWAVVESESANSWQWFFELLLKDIGFLDGAGLTIISDMQKGLIEAVGLVFPDAEHRLCAKHWYANWSTKFRGLGLKDLFWDCVRPTYPESLAVNIQKLDSLRDGASKRAISIPAQKWTKAYMRDTSKCDIAANIMCENFILSIMSARENSIITMLETIRVIVMKRIDMKRRLVKKWRHDISPNAKRSLELRKSKRHEWRTDFNGSYGYEVSLGDYGFKHRQAIDLRGGTCSCRLWNISGIPCTHVVCAIYYSHLNLEDYISHWYKKDTYVKTYQFSIQHVRGVESWVSDNPYKILPPKEGRPVDRPKTNVQREVRVEPQLFGKLSRRGTIISCSICGKEGHNKRGCIPGIVFAPPREHDGANTSRGRGQGKRCGSRNEDVLDEDACTSKRTRQNTGFN